MKRFEFVFEAPHPEDPTVTLRFIINVPYVDPTDVPAGAILETFARSRDGDHG